MNELIELITEKQQFKEISDLEKAEKETFEHFFEFYDSKKINMSELISRMFTDVENGVSRILRLKKQKHIVFKEKYKNRNTKAFLKLMLNFYKKTLKIRKDKVPKNLSQKRKKYIKKFKKENYSSYNALFNESIYQELESIIKAHNIFSRNKVIENMLLALKDYDFYLFQNSKWGSLISELKEREEKLKENKKQISFYLKKENKKEFMKLKKELKLTHKEIIYIAIKNITLSRENNNLEK